MDRKISDNRSICAEDCSILRIGDILIVIKNHTIDNIHSMIYSMLWTVNEMKMLINFKINTILLYI